MKNPSLRTGTAGFARMDGVADAAALALCVTACLVLILASAATAEVVGWRSDGTGSYPGADAVAQWSETTNVIWKTALPAWANATPVIVGERIIVTSEPTDVLALAKADGEILWRVSLDYASVGIADAGRRPRAHGSNGYASPTPVSDGEQVYVLLGTGVAAALDVRTGEVAWARLIEQPRHGWGHSASPLLADGNLIVHIGQLHALDPQTGQSLWAVDAPVRWGTPVTTSVGETPIIITPAGDVFRAADGHRLAQEVGSLAYATPLVDGDRVYFIENNAVAIRLPASAAEPFDVDRLWTARIQGSRHYASALLHEGLLYAASREERFAVLDAETGEVLDQSRLRLGGRSADSVYPSVTLAGPHVLVSSESGQTLVFAPGREPEQLAHNTLEGFRASPVLDGDRMYIRGFEHLYCIGRTDEP